MGVNREPRVGKRCDRTPPRANEHATVLILDLCSQALPWRRGGKRNAENMKMHAFLSEVFYVKLRKVSNSNSNIIIVLGIVNVLYCCSILPDSIGKES